jgi:hypothetical protein
MIELPRLCDKVYHFLCRIFLGWDDAVSPPRWLYIIWVVMGLAWIYPATLSLWEDEIWMLVVSVDQPWKTVLGLQGYYTGNHILYSLIAKGLFLATFHHGQEFVYRLPALFAAWLSLPLTFAVFARWGGRFIAMLGSLLCCLLPAFVYHAANARGYSLWYLLALIAFGISPGMNKQTRWLRLCITYLLLGLSHSVSFITVGALSLCGCFTGKYRATVGGFVKNGTAAIPFFIYWIIPFQSVFHYERSVARPESWVITDKLGFIPAVIEQYFGTPWFPGLGFLWTLIIIIGLTAVLRRALTNGIALAFLSCSIGIVVLVTGNPFGFGRIFMGCLPIWLLLAGVGLSSLRDQIMHRIPSSLKNISIILFTALLALPWSPKLLDYLILPKQDYRGLYREYTANFPNEKTIYSPTWYYATGVSYYARQFNMNFVVLQSPEAASDSLLSSGTMRGLIVPALCDVPPVMREWLTEHMALYKEWSGINLPTQLYVPKQVNRLGAPTAPYDISQ